MGLCRHASGLSGIVHLLAMLVRSRQEKSGAPFHPLVSTEHVSRDRCVGVSDVRLAIYVVNWSGNVYRIVDRQRVLLAFAGTIRVAWRRQSVRRRA